MKAKDIMSLNVANIPCSATVAEAVRLLRLTQLRALIVEPITEEDTYGIVTQSDIAIKVIALARDPDTVCVSEIMSKPCIVIDPELSLENVSRLFAQTDIWRAPVIKDDLVGIISVTDIINKGDFVSKQKLIFLKAELQKAISNARSICGQYGVYSLEAADAWKLVDQVEAEAIANGAPKPEKSARHQFAEESKVEDFVLS
ncbi:MAG: CBS domain-containing protein [Rivularia sp. ALOHA_DT_140]|nr:CBS domain-containing protein [Rivularia sp. ALOHA_DT_140]